MTNDLTYELDLDLDIETLQDYSGNSRISTNSGSTLSVNKDNILNQSRDFVSASNQYISMYDLDTSGDYTIAFWFNADTLAGNPLIVSKDSGTHPTRDLYIQLVSTGRIQAACFDTSSGSHLAQSDIGLFNVGEWHHVVFVRDATNNRNDIYLDGHSVANNTDTYTHRDSSTVIGVGGRFQNNDLYYDGKIGQYFKTWTEALSATQAYQLYLETAHNYQGLFDSLLGGWDSRKDFKDFSGNGNDGTILSPSLTNDKFGVDNSAYDYNDTSGDYISLGNISPTGTDFTFLIMTNFDTITNNTSTLVVSKDNGSTRDFYIGVLDNGTVRFRVNDKSPNLADSATGLVAPGNWHVIMCTCDDSNLDVYLDGLNIKNVSSTGSISWTNQDLEIGRFGNGGNLFDGKSSVSLYWDRKLSADEAKQISDLLHKGYIYPYPQERLGGISQWVVY